MNPAPSNVQTIAAAIDGALFSEPLSAHLSAALNLAKPSDYPSMAPERIDAENGKKLSHMLQAALHLCAFNFPMLTEDDWLHALEATQFASCNERSLMMDVALQPRDRPFLLNEIYQGFDEDEFDALDISRLEKIGPNETLSILIVSDHFWSKPLEQRRSLREILSAVSGRPKESVFFDDPTIEDLWMVEGLEFMSELEGTATFTYNGEKMATLGISVTPDKKGIRSGELICQETRPLVLPGQSLKGTLFRMALNQIDTAIL